MPCRDKIARIIYLQLLLVCTGALFFFTDTFCSNNRSLQARVIEPDGRKKPAESDVPFTTLDKGVSSGVASLERLAVKDDNTWICLWKRHTSTDLAPPTIPFIDFDRHMIIAVFQGENAPAGMVSIDRVRRFKDRIVVYTSRSDYADGANARTATRSYHIVRTQRNNLPVVFN